jgi:hypothetical protein
MAGHLLNVLADQTIVVESRPSGQSGDFYLAIFGEFIFAVNKGDNYRM